MKLEFNSKSQEYGMDGNPTATKITLTNIEGAVYPVLLPPEVITLSNTELTTMALDKIYEDNFPGRAEKEKFDTLERHLKAVQSLNDEIKNGITTMDNAIEYNKEVVLWVGMKLFEKGVIDEEELIGFAPVEM